jgi:hypothetical protein
MSKTTRKAIQIEKLVSSDSVNARLADNYDLESLRPQIIGKGRIVNPLVVEPMADGMYMVLQGNRRLRCALMIIADPAAPADVKAALAKLDCNVYEGLSDEERDALIFDHGESRPLNREETLLGVWRMFKGFKKEKDIGERMYYQLARYTGNEKKLNQLPPNVADRTRYLSTWFRGTLGQYMLSAATMTDEVREAMVMTARKEDGRLKEGETVPFTASRERIVELSKCRTADEKAGGWDNVKGGESFNAAIQRYKDEDANRAQKPEKSKRPSVKALTDAAGLYKSAALKAAFAVASGDDTAGAALLTMDDAIHRQTIVAEILVKAIPAVADQNVKSLLTALVGSGPAADVEAALAPFVK